MARKRANLSDLLNDLTFKVTYDKFKLIALNEYEWGGLPDGILERHVERELFARGFTSLFRHPRMSYMSLPCDSTGRLNVYGDPLRYRATGQNFSCEFNADDGVIIENNKLRLPTRDFILFYVNKITEAERTMDVNVKANKTPVVVLCDDKDVLSFKRIFQQVDGNAPAVFADRSINLDNMQALDLKAKFLGNELMDYKKSVENELLTFLGINNIPAEKKERLITDEANSNNQLIESFFDLGLEARQRACNEIKKLYGLDVTVKRREKVLHNPVVENVGKDGDGNV
jgi:hypothetical protein